MPTTPGPNASSPSTTFVWKRVRIASPAAGQGARPAQQGRWYHLGRWPRRQKLTLVVKSRGGSECWYEVRARGSAGRFPGHMALHDVMSEIYGEG